jgi:hypothetical protein
LKVLVPYFHTRIYLEKIFGKEISFYSPERQKKKPQPVFAYVTNIQFPHKAETSFAMDNAMKGSRGFSGWLAKAGRHKGEYVR